MNKSQSKTADYSIETRQSLLERLKGNEDQAGWQEFFNTYWRLIYAVAIKAGLRDDEAHDVVHDAVISVSRNLPEFQYDPDKCSFKTWLLNLTRWRIADAFRRRRSQSKVAISAFPQEADFADNVPDSATPLETIWETEWEANLLQIAAQRVKQLVKPKQYQMFYLHVLKQLPASQVAARLGASLSSVYLARHIVGRRFKDEIKLLQAQTL